MIELIAVGTSDEALDELWVSEAAWANRLLLRQLPTQARLIHSSATGLAGLGQYAGKLAGTLGLSKEAQILLCTHREILLAPTCLAALSNACEHAKRPVCAYSNFVPPTDAPPDYLTLRGMERYAETLGTRGTGTPTMTSTASVCLARAEDILNPEWLGNSQFAAGAYCHDFSGYRANRREEMLALLPAATNSILDVGGGFGGFLQAVKEKWPTCRTALAEMSPAACALAQDAVDRVWQGDFLALDIGEQFDCITFLDVLEHVIDPQMMLNKARQRLTSSGCVVASIPNIGHWSVIADLLEGRWDYAPAGIQCITHLRFFTKKSIEELFAEAGFVIERWETAHVPPPSWFAPLPAAPLAIDLESLSAVAWHLCARRT